MPRAKSKAQISVIFNSGSVVRSLYSDPECFALYVSRHASQEERKKKQGENEERGGKSEWLGVV